MAIKYWGGGKVTGVESDTMPANAQTGWHFYETDTDSLHLYTGSAWTALGGGSSDIQQATSTRADNAHSSSLEATLHDGGSNPTSYGNIPNKTVTFTPTAGNSVVISASVFGWVTDSDSNGSATGTAYASIIVGGSEKKVVSNDFSVTSSGGLAAGAAATIYVWESAVGSSTAFGARFKIGRSGGDGTHCAGSASSAVEVG
jgi:hypothetical protein